MHFSPSAARGSALALAVAMLTAACSGNGGRGHVTGHTRVSVGNVTYDWPYDGASDGDPDKWKGFALISNAIWNESIGAVSSLKRLPDSGSTSIDLAQEKLKEWDIDLDGSGVPVIGNGSFVKTEDHGAYVIGDGIGPGIVNPSTIVIFRGERSAYVECLKPNKVLPEGFCMLKLNDRGVGHVLPFSWGKWGEGPAVLKLYRTLIGIPEPKANQRV